MVATSLWSSAIAEWLIRKSPLLSKTQPVLVALLAFSAALNLAIYYTDVRGLLGHNDFRLYYAGAEVGLRYGWSAIYDVSLHQAAVAALQPTGPWYAMLLPAPMAWLVSPLTMLGYPAAYWVWVALSIAALAAVVWYVRPRQRSAALYLLWWAALGPLWFSAYEGQVTILATAGLLAGWRLLETRRDYVGGLGLGAALFKPYLVLLLPLTLLASGRLAGDRRCGRNHVDCRPWQTGGHDRSGRSDGFSPRHASHGASERFGLAPFGAHISGILRISNIDAAPAGGAACCKASLRSLRRCHGRKTSKGKASHHCLPRRASARGRRENPIILLSKLEVSR